ncbi:MAG: GNAT family N-acetyltransferase [Chloroflexota bacterium]
MLGPIIRGEGVSLEPPRLDDLETYRSWFANTDVTRYLLMRFVLSEDGEAEWFRRVASESNSVVWRVVVDGRTIGNTGIHGIDWINRHATTGTVIGEMSQWGKGYGSQLVRLRTDYAFRQLGLERLDTQTLSMNIGMQRCLEKSGYQRVGICRRYIFQDGVWNDMVLYGLLRDEWEAARSKP